MRRMLVLTFLFVGTLYYFAPNEEQDAYIEEDSIDSIKLKMGAVARPEPRLLTMASTPTEAPAAQSKEMAHETAEAEEVSDLESADKIVDRSPVGTMEHVQDVQWDAVEKGWHSELKEVLNRLEPAEGETIHRAYMSEQESYQVELNGLLSEKQQKDSDKGVQEIEQLIQQLDSKHEAQLKEILGAHYGAVKDQYDEYLEKENSDSH